MEAEDRISLTIGRSRLEIVMGDITRQETDAIVNAANSRLTPGGGVSGAIHRAAGAGLREECKKLGGCKTGEAKITKGYNLPARYVIHTVGPVFSHASRERNAELLRKCYESSLGLAIEHGIKSISFPAISTGIYGYPMEEAADIAVRTIADFLRKHDEIKVVRMVLYGRDAFEAHKRAMKKLSEETDKISYNP